MNKSMAGLIKKWASILMVAVFLLSSPGIAGG